METINLSETELLSLESSICQIITDFPTSIRTVKHMSVLADCINSYRLKKEYLHPELRLEVMDMIESGKIITKSSAGNIARIASLSCKSCIFHNENCMINITFIIFKSIEIGKFIGFSKLRPGMRMVF